MSGDEVNKKSIIDIFNDMDFEEKLDYSTDSEGPNANPNAYISNELIQTLKVTKEPKSFDNVVNAAIKAQKTWKSLSALQRADSLHKIWKQLTEISKSLSELKNEFLILVDYFDFYTDFAIQTEEYKNWRAHRVVLVVLNDYSPYYVLGAVVPAALAAGSSVIVLATENTKFITLFLQEVIQSVGLEEGLFSVVTEIVENDLSIFQKVNKVFFCGSYLEARTCYAKCLAQSFDFFCPNNTATLILESCDLSAAVDKIVVETWGKSSLFRVTNVVVQESVHKIFLRKLQHRVERLVAENINSLKFKDKAISEKINKIVSEAIKAGATVEICTKNENAIEWSPTVIVNYQNQHVDEDVPILKVLLCRTAKEGVTLLNNCHCGLGTSVWTEISSQALEVSSMLNCPNVWINCHGVFEPGVPLQPCSISGDCVLGGTDGLLQYVLFTPNDPVEKYKSSDDDWSHADKTNAFQMAVSAHEAFKSWMKINRRKYLKDIEKALSPELSENFELIRKCALGNKFNLSERNIPKDFLVVRNKLPIGVILLIVYAPTIDTKNLILEVIPPIAFGNAVIVVLREDNPSVKISIKNFNNYLPKNVLNVVVGLNIGIQLASDPNIQAIWIDNESTVSEKYLETIKSHSEKSLKHIWIIPKGLSVSHHLYEKECLHNKVVWLTKVDQFP